MIVKDNKDIFSAAERAIDQMYHCQLKHSAKDIEALLKYAKGMEKVQRGLIRTLLKKQRQIKYLYKLIRLGGIEDDSE